ncbi:hypothetical protein LAZ67_8001097 [Cordylochernes scorpioides]|uniref:Peptidase aspartic putative domain-containing protein n=1 Tax=Cordylochernes scorpioides TaxID=51811 RepID=A0ABY6KT53_9ARAC|nr:hypothetical protein LAZ67_8001097 [Cordylochernes scorpioides]
MTVIQGKWIILMIIRLTLDDLYQQIMNAFYDAALPEYQMDAEFDKAQVIRQSLSKYLDSLLKGTGPYKIVSGYHVMEENYERAVGALKKLYGDKEVLIQVHVRGLLKMFIATIEGRQNHTLTEFHDELETHLQSLEALKFAEADPATILFPQDESTLPRDVMIAWQRSPDSEIDGNKETPKKTKLYILWDFLERKSSGNLIELKKNGIKINDVGRESYGDRILIGANYWGKFMLDRKEHLECGLTKLENMFGWILIGEYLAQRKDPENNVAMTVLSIENLDIKQLWDFESIRSEVSPRNDFEGHFLPHRPVYKNSPTTPVRPVFDASCIVGNNVSLNQCLETGDNLIQLIPDI